MEYLTALSPWGSASSWMLWNARTVLFSAHQVPSTLNMIRLDDKIRLTDNEKDRLSFYALEPANPDTVKDHDAWIDHATNEVWDGDTPEEKLMRAILSDQKIER